MKDANTWPARVRTLESDELAAVLTVDAAHYPGGFLELARQELQSRGFIFRGNGEDGITTPDGVRLAPRPGAHDPGFDPRLKGVGGWLLVFILSQLLCRPLSILSEGLGTNSALIERFASDFPSTALLLNVDKMLSFGLMVFGLVVAVALLNKGSSSPVKLAKTYLIAHPLVQVFVAVLCGFTDFPAELREHLAQGVMTKAVMASVWSLIWILYFNRSRRVQATYFADEYTHGQDDGGGGQAVTRLGLGG